MSLFTQSVYVLTSSAFTVDDLETALAAFDILGNIEKPSEDHWAFGGEGLILSGVRPGSRLLVDIIGNDWKDAFEDPEDPVLGAVWEAGGFGPLVFPGCIERAGKQAWAWKLASAAVRTHNSFVRLRMTFASDNGGEPKISDGDALEDLSFLTLAAAALLSNEDKAICFFNPNGEALRSKELVHSGLDHHAETGEPPLDLWTNLRLTRIGDGVVRMDSVGMQQFGLPDFEAVFPEGTLPYADVDRFLRDLMLYLLDRGDVVGDGDVVDGPSGDWKAERIQAEGPPPRPVLRFAPVNPLAQISA
jgi:hypothetical protein